MNWHCLSKEEILQKLETNVSGLSEEEARQRTQKYGLNELPEKLKKPWWKMLLYQFKDIMIIILLAAAAISIFIGDLKDSIVIMIIVVINAAVGFIQEFKAEKALAALKKMSSPNAKVIRSGGQKTIPTENLVPGDIVVFEAGDMIPADLRLINTHALRIEEAALTGESTPSEKQTDVLDDEMLQVADRTNMSFKGTIVSHGRGSGIVIGTGLNTELGSIAEMLTHKEPPTPLQKRLSDFAKKLSYAVLSICVILYVVGLLRGEEPVKMLLTAISVAVAAIPEALPAVITIALALGAKKLVEKNALIRKLPAVETLGSVTFICSDKTGTLTQNKMTVKSVWINQNLKVEFADLSREDILLFCMVVNQDTHFNEQKKLKGESTEIALVQYALQAKPDIENFSEKYPRVYEMPFDAERKMMTTVHESTDEYIVVTKGAFESILQLDNSKDHNIFSGKAQEMAEKGMRVIAYAIKTIQKENVDDIKMIKEEHLAFVGLTGLVDPPREEAKQAVKECLTAGIVPVMITGDHPATAHAIAAELGIVKNENDRIITGRELDNLSEEQFLEQVEHIKVYARVNPKQKLHIVETLQKRGDFVAMTGDGVNDAPALKKANIGIAMGIMGTDVSKEAADMILLDDNFATIVKSIKEGRRIFDNIRKFIKYTMTSNGGEIWTIFLAPLVGLPIPLLPIHILWINLVTDGLPGLALVKEKAEKNIMLRKPRDPQESIFTGGMTQHILWIGLLMGAVCLSVQAYAQHNHDPKWQTYVFTVLCFSQMGHVMAIRSEEESLFKIGVFSNLSLIGAILLTFVLQLLIIYIPFLQDIFSTQSLTIIELTGCLLMSSIVFWTVEIEKRLRKKKN